ncbi:Uncharacterized protein SCF082_LOCUS6092 [Durusdinium trenchii]|uniref:Uncharacterized protein n=1 Tax=Durusdinium trenchii TaxID=1381693 RepID=A0ABP0IAC4_9DINO
MDPSDGVDGGRGSAPSATPEEHPGAEQYTFSDDEEEEDDVISDVEDAAGAARRSIRERLSVMFEHNDLINNRMAVLTKAIREGPLQPADAPAAPAPSAPAAVAAAAATVASGMEELGDGSGDRSEPTGPEASQSAPASQGSEFLQAMPASTPTRKSIKAQGYQDISVETSTVPGAKSELWSKARSAVAQTFTPEDRRQLRRELRVERAHRKRLERELGSLRTELAKCESIVEHLVEEIEEQTRRGALGASTAVAEAKAAMEGKQLRQKAAEPGVVDDLKGALSRAAQGTRRKGPARTGSQKSVGKMFSCCLQPSVEVENDELLVSESRLQKWWSEQVTFASMRRCKEKKKNSSSVKYRRRHLCGGEEVCVRISKEDLTGPPHEFIKDSMLAGKVTSYEEFREPLWPFCCFMPEGNPFYHTSPGSC